MRFAFLLAVIITLAPVQTNAQCTRDVECKGERVCENGLCVNPGKAAVPAPPASSASGPRTPVAPASKSPAVVACTKDSDCGRFAVCREGQCAELRPAPRCASHPSDATSADYHSLEPITEAPPPIRPVDRTGLFAFRYRIEMADERDYPCSLFATNTKGRGVYTLDSIPAYVGRTIGAALGRYGMTMVAADEQVLLRFSLQRALVEEGKIYSGEVLVQVDAFQGDEGRPFWSGKVRGTARSWGRTGLLEGYQHVLGHATLDCARSLLDDLGFLGAMKQRVGAAQDAPASSATRGPKAAPTTP